MDYLLQLILYVFLFGKLNACHAPRHSEEVTLQAARSLQTLENPGYPSNYYSSNDCKWILESYNTSFRVLLDMKNYSVESGPGCRYDSLQLFDGTSISDPEILKACTAVTFSPMYVSTSQHALVRLKSDSSVQLTGFTMRYLMYDGNDASSCGNMDIATKPAEIGYIQSPSFPVMPNTFATCTWKLTGSGTGTVHGFVIELLFMDIAVGTEKLTVYEGSDTTGTKLAEWSFSRHTFIPMTPIYNNISNNVFIRFQTQNSGTERSGFVLSYNETNTGVTLVPVTTQVPLPTYSTCSSSQTIVATTSPQLLTSPSYPTFYSEFLSCSWTIQAPVGNIVFLTINDLSMELTGACKGDSVSIYDGSSSAFPLLGKFCGTTSFDINSTSSSLHLAFTSDGSVADRGFKFQFMTSASGTPNCVPDNNSTFNLVVNKTVQYFDSPLYPDVYDFNQRIIWVIHNPTDVGFIKVEVVDTRVEASYKCVYDYVKIYKGPCDTYPLLGSFCGHDADVFYNDAGSYVLIVFRSDYNVHFKGFRMSYVVVDEIPKEDEVPLLLILAIVLGVVFGLLFLGLAILCFIIAIKRYRNKKERLIDEDENDTLEKVNYISDKKLSSLTVTKREKIPKTRKPKKKASLAIARA